MFCASCGTQLPDEAKFCLKCGKPQSPDVRVEEPRWETCKVKWYSRTSEAGLLLGMVGINREKGYYQGDAIGLRGVCVAGKTDVCSEKNSHELFQNLVKQLGQEGWEPTGDFDPHAIVSFRRRVK